MSVASMYIGSIPIIAGLSPEPPPTASYAFTASFALNGGGSSLSTGSTYPFTSSWAENANALNIANAYSITSLTASTGILVGPSTDATAQFYISASNANIAAIEVDNSSGVETFQLSQTILTLRVPIQSSYVTLATPTIAAPGITCSFLDAKEYVTFNTGSVTWTFTSSNVPASGIYATTTLYISNTNVTTNTASLSFPAGWKWLGLTPTYITASKDAELNLESFGGNVVAVWAPQY